MSGMKETKKENFSLDISKDRNIFSSATMLVFNTWLKERGTASIGVTKTIAARWGSLSLSSTLASHLGHFFAVFLSSGLLFVFWRHKMTQSILRHAHMCPNMYVWSLDCVFGRRRTEMGRLRQKRAPSDSVITWMNYHTHYRIFQSRNTHAVA